MNEKQSLKKMINIYFKSIEADDISSLKNLIHRDALFFSMGNHNRYCSHSKNEIVKNINVLKSFPKNSESQENNITLQSIDNILISDAVGFADIKWLYLTFSDHETHRGSIHFVKTNHRWKIYSFIDRGIVV